MAAGLVEGHGAELVDRTDEFHLAVPVEIDQVEELEIAVACRTPSMRVFSPAAGLIWGASLQSELGPPPGTGLARNCLFADTTSVFTPPMVISSPGLTMVRLAPATALYSSSR